MQVDARFPDRDAQLSRKCLYSPEHYCEILRTALEPLETGRSAALLVTAAIPRLSIAWRPQLTLQLQCGPEHPSRSDKWSGRGVAEPEIMVWCLRKRLKS